MKKYLPTIIFGTVVLIAVAVLFTYLGTRPQKTVGDSEGDENVLAMKLSDDGSFYTVTGLGSYSESELIIPHDVDGIPIKEIGRWAFREERNITSVVIPDTVEKICESAFKSTSITEITVPDSVKYIEGYVFADCRGLEKAVLPKNVDFLGEHLFENCERLVTVALPENLKEIPAYTFARCTLLESVALPDGVESIGEYAFNDCNSLRHIDLPKSIKTVSDSAFNMARLEEIILPKGLKEIGSNAFMGNPVDEITLPDGLEIIGSRAFEFTGITNVFIPASVKEIGFEAFGGRYEFSDSAGISKVIISEENPVYFGTGGCVITRDEGELVLTLDPGSVPDDGSVKIIGPFAYGNVNAEVVAVPEGVTEIRSGGISDYEYIGEIRLPASLERIEYGGVSAVNHHNEAAERIVFEGTPEQWAAMEKDENWLSGTENVLIIEVG